MNAKYMLKTKCIINKLLPMEFFTLISQVRDHGFEKLYCVKTAGEYVRVFVEEAKELYFLENIGLLPITTSTDGFSDVGANQNYLIQSMLGKGFVKQCMGVDYVPDDSMLQEIEDTFKFWDRCDERINSYRTGGIVRRLKNWPKRALLRRVKNRRDKFLCMQNLCSAAISLFVRRNLGTPEVFAARMLQLTKVHG